MEEPINPNKGFAFYYFDLNQAQGKHIYAVVMAHYLHHDLYQKDLDSIIIYFRNEVIPTLKKRDKWMQDEINQRDSMWMTIGGLSTIDPMYWQWAIQFKRDTYENTLIEVYKDSNDHVAGKISPLN